MGLDRHAPGRMVQDGHAGARAPRCGQPGQAGGVGRGDGAAWRSGQRAVAEDQPHPGQVPGPRPRVTGNPQAGDDRDGVDRDS